jgi:predicted component of type VI protein secretion system
MKRMTERLHDFSPVNIDEYVDLFKETLHVRRQYIRENSTADVITKFTGHSFPSLVR